MPIVEIAGFNRANARLNQRDVPSSGAGEEAVAGLVSGLAGQLATNSIQRADGIRAVRARGEFDRTTTQQIADLDATSPTYIEEVGDVYQSAREAASSTGFASATNAAQFNLGLEQQAQAGTTSALMHQHTQLAKAAEGEFQVLALDTLAKIVDDPTNYPTWQAAMDQQIEQFGDAIPAAAQEAMAADFAKRAVEAQVEGFANRGQHDIAKATIEENQGILTGAQARSLGQLQKSIFDRQKAEANAEFSRKFAGVETNVIEASGVRDLMTIREQIETLENEGAFFNNPKAKPMLLRQVEAKQKSMVSDTRELEADYAQYTSGLGFDDQKQADRVYKSMKLQAIDAGASEQEILDMAMDMTRRGGIAPSEVTSIIERSERVDNPEQLASAAFIKDKMREEAPSALARIDGDTTKSSLTSALVQSGMDYPEAAETTLELTKDKAAVKERKELFTEQFKDTDLREEMSDAGLGDVNQIPAAQVEAFRTVTRAMFEITGDRELAISAASQEFSKRTGPSDLAGGLTQELPVENTFPQRHGLQTSDVNELVGADVEALFGEVGMPVPEDFGGKKGWRLISDAQTKRDLAEGRPPTYAVETIQFPAGEFGIYMRQNVLDENGAQFPMRWGQFSNKDLATNPLYAKKVASSVTASRRRTTPQDEDVSERLFRERFGF